MVSNIASTFVDGVWLDDILIVALTDRVVVFDKGIYVKH